MPKTTGRRARGIINYIVRVLHKDKFVKDVGIKVTEVFKGGSLGQGTAIPGHYDIDLVLYSRDLEVEDFISDSESDSDEDGDSDNQSISDYLDSISDYLEEKLTNKFTFLDTTDVAIKFNIKDPMYGLSLDVDLLLSPYFEDQHAFLKCLRDIDPPDRRLFSASTSKWQTHFIQIQHSWVKEFCRRAKAWRNVAWQGVKEGRPKSYLMCMLVIIAYNRVPADMKAVKRMRSFAPRMTGEFKKLVKEIESSPHLDLSIPGSNLAIEEAYKDLLDKPPRIIDPANPSNNLYKSGISKTPGGRKWDSFAVKVDSLDLSLSPDKIMV